MTRPGRAEDFATVISGIGAAWGFTTAEREAAWRHALEDELAQEKRRLNEALTRLIAGDASAGREAELTQQNIARIQAELALTNVTQIAVTQRKKR